MPDNITPRKRRIVVCPRTVIPFCRCTASPKPVPALAAMPLALARQAPLRAARPARIKGRDRDLDAIRAWFAEHYWLSYGVVTDALLVVDIDPRNSGDKTWAAISGQPTRALPHTWRVRTGGGGEHICFQEHARHQGRRPRSRHRDQSPRAVTSSASAARTRAAVVYEWQPQCNHRKRRR